jgi:Flp pilus assembly protein TadD
MKISISPTPKFLGALIASLVVAQAPGFVSPGSVASLGSISLISSAHAQSSTQSVNRQTPTHDSVRSQAIEIAGVRKLQASRKPEEALRAARRAIRKYPNNTQLRFLLGVTLADANKPSEAISVFEALNRDHPELAEPYNNLAVLHAANGDLDAARDSLVAAIRVVPDYTLALQNLGDVYLRMAARSYEAANEINGAPNRILKRKLTRARAVVESLTTDN